jgi:hypothetical protein
MITYGGLIQGIQAGLSVTLMLWTFQIPQAEPNLNIAVRTTACLHELAFYSG